MPGLVTLLSRVGSEQPLSGAKIVGCTHLTAHTGAFIRALIKLGAQVRWCACNIFSTQDEVAAALVMEDIPIYAWEGEAETDFWWCIDQCIDPAGWVPTFLVDDGGDATARMAEKFPKKLEALTGIVEESMNGVLRLYKLCKKERLTVAAMNIQDSVLKSRFDHLYSIRECIVDCLKRTADCMLAGKMTLICGYGTTGKATVDALKYFGLQICVTEVDPICALQACMEGYRVVRIEEVISQVDLVIVCNRNKNVITKAHMDQMKSGCMLCNMGSSNLAIDVESLHHPELKWQQLRSELDHIIWPDGKRIVLIAEGRQMYPSCSCVPSLVLSVTITTQLLALIELHTSPAGRYKKDIYLMPKKMDEYVASLHLPHFNANLTELTTEQSQHLGINKAGPFKATYYKY